MGGWICLYRDIQNHWVFQDAEYFRAWVDLLMLANHEKNTFILKGQLVTCDRGQVGYSQQALGKRWNWHRDRVKRFIVLLEKDKMIAHQSTHLNTTITICNYSIYQDKATTEATADTTPGKASEATPEATPEATQTTRITNKQINNENNKETFTSVNVEKKPKKEKFEIPDWLNEKAWEEFREHRKSIKKPMTVTGEVKGSNILKPYSFEEQQQIIDNSIFGKYPGLYPDCLNKKQKINNSSNNKNIDSFVYKPSIFKTDSYDQSKIIEGELT